MCRGEGFPTRGTTIAVSVERLSFTYPGSDEKVLDNVSFNVEGGERIAIIGPNGVGKTTLMRCLAGELPSPQQALDAHPGVRPGADRGATSQ